MLVKFSIDTKHMFEVLMYEYVYNMYKIVYIYIYVYTIWLSIISAERERETSRESERAREREREREGGREGGREGTEGGRGRKKRGRGRGERKRGRGRGRKKERERKRERGRARARARARGREGEREREGKRNAFPPFSLFICMNRLICPYCQVAFLVWPKERNTKTHTVLGNQGVRKFREHTEAVNYLAQLLPPHPVALKPFRNATTTYWPVCPPTIEP